VRAAIGWAMTFFTFVTGDCEVDWELVDRDKVLVEFD
jgi:hypothetical protein